MKKKLINRLNGFTPEQIKNWEASDGVNFAIALARITGWLLHVDWWNPSQENSDVHLMKSLRVFVGDNTSRHVFDLRGKFSLNSFLEKIIKPLQRQRGENYGGVLTRYYSEDKLFELPLRVKPDKKRIEVIEAIIKENKAYLDKVPVRTLPLVPAHIAAEYSFSKCVIFAAAMQQMTGKKATAIIANEYTEQFGLSKPGFSHSVIVENDSVLDVWGKTSIENVLERYGIKRYTLDEKQHSLAVDNLRRNSPERFTVSLEECLQIIKQYF